MHNAKDSNEGAFFVVFKVHPIALYQSYLHQIIFAELQYININIITINPLRHHVANDNEL